MSQLNPKLTDEAIDALPLHHGRTELLEEIMNTTVLDDSPSDWGVRAAASRRPSRYLVPLAAASVVAALATITLWWSADEPAAPGFATAPVSTAPAEGDPYRVLLDAPGWTVDDASAEADIAYAKGDATLEINWYDADLYSGYIADREQISEPSGPGEPVQVLGRAGQLWAYNAHDHTVIRQVEAGHWMEIRGQSIDRAGYLDLLVQLRLVGLDDFEAGLPARFVTTVERDPATEAIVAGIAEKLGPARGLSPMGTAQPTFASSANGRYDLGADIAGAVACGWLAQYDVARARGDSGAMTDAAQALATSHRWPILLELEPVGDYPEVLWEYADETAAGKSVDGYRAGLGCS